VGGLISEWGWVAVVTRLLREWLNERKN